MIKMNYITISDQLKQIIMIINYIRILKKCKMQTNNHNN